MSVTKGFIFGILISILNANYIENSKLGCHGSVYWNFNDLNVHDSLSLKNDDNNGYVCRNACNNDNNCDGWGINVNNNNICNLFKFNNINKELIYNCQYNDITKYYGELKQCLHNNHLTNSIIMAYGNAVNAKFAYDAESKCYKTSVHSEGMKAYDI